MHIVVYADQLAGSLTGLSRELIGGARAIAGADGKVDVLLVGGDAAKITDLGADRILNVTGHGLDRYNPGAFTHSVAAVIEQEKPDLVLFGYCTAGLDIGPWLAIGRDMPLVSYCTKVSVTDAGLDVESQIYGGKMVASSTVALPAVLLVNPGVYREAEAGSGTSEIVGIAARDVRPGTTFLSAAEPDPNAVDITKADRLLCVGRGVGDTDAVEDARRAAELLGAELAGSRPVVDAGWLPKERQVGKSGRKVKPRLYLAVGVSGAPEHLEGMASAGTIVAINSDARAPIFDHAHFGATVDAADFIEALTDALDK